MEHYRRTAHTRFDIKFHLVWITKYREKVLRGEVGPRLRQIVRTICAELEVGILKGHISSDHVHLFVSCPPHVSASYLMQRLKGKSSRNLMQEYSHLKKLCWGRHLWARGFFVASSGNVTDEVIMEAHGAKRVPWRIPSRPYLPSLPFKNFAPVSRSIPLSAPGRISARISPSFTIGLPASWPH